MRSKGSEARHAHRNPQGKLRCGRRAVRFEHAEGLAGDRPGAAGAVPLHGQRLLAVPGLPGGHQRGQCRRTQHPDRVHRPGQPGAGRVHGAGSLHRRDHADEVGHAVPVQHSGRRRGCHAGWSGGGHSFPARQGPVPGYRNDRGIVHCPLPVRQHGHYRWHRRPVGPASPMAGRGAGHLVSHLLADRARHRPAAAGCRQPVSHPHRSGVHRHP